MLGGFEVLRKEANAACKDKRSHLAKWDSALAELQSPLIGYKEIKNKKKIEQTQALRLFLHPQPALLNHISKA